MYNCSAEATYLPSVSRFTDAALDIEELENLSCNRGTYQTYIQSKNSFDVIFRKSGQVRTYKESNEIKCDATHPFYSIFGQFLVVAVNACPAHAGKESLHGNNLGMVVQCLRVLFCLLYRNVGFRGKQRQRPF